MQGRKIGLLALLLVIGIGGPVLMWQLMMSTPALSEQELCRGAIATHFLQRQLGEIKPVAEHPGYYALVSTRGETPHTVYCQQQGQALQLSENRRQVAQLFFQQKGRLTTYIVPREAAPNRTRQFTYEQLHAPSLSLAKHDLATAVHEMYGEGFEGNQTIQQSVLLLQGNHICALLERQQQQSYSPAQSPNAYRQQLRLLTPYLINLVQRSRLSVEQLLETKQQIQEMEQQYSETLPRLVEWLLETDSANPLDERLLEHQFSDLKRANPRLVVPDSCYQVYVHSAQITQTL